jgi:hypothetical protein
MIYNTVHRFKSSDSCSKSLQEGIVGQTSRNTEQSWLPGAAAGGRKSQSTESGIFSAIGFLQEKIGMGRKVNRSQIHFTDTGTITGTFSQIQS